MDESKKEERTQEEVIKLATVVTQTSSIQNELKEFKENTKDDFAELKAIIAAATASFISRPEFEALEKRVASLEYFINWTVRIVLGAVILSGLALLLKNVK